MRNHDVTTLAAEGTSMSAVRAIDVPTYYRRAMLAPVLLCSAGVFFAPLTNVRFSHLLQDIGGYFAIIALAGFFGAIPYGLFVAVLWYVVEPRSERQFRAAAWLAPLVVSALFSVGSYLLLGWPSGSGEPAWFVVGSLSAPGLLFGYALVVLIEGSLWVALRRGWVARRAFSDVLVFEADQCPAL